MPFLVLALVLAAVAWLRSGDALDSGEEIPDGRAELFLERARDTAGIDCGDRFLLELLREAQSPTVIAAGQRLRDLVAPGRQCRGNRSRKLRLRGDALV
ncbi:MAG TPA: hypothetical protein VIL73_04125 [Gaiellaceae bacterium]